MFFAAVTNIVSIFVGVVLVWSWVAFISEAIARRTGRTNAVPYPDEVLWARYGRFLLDLGLFGGAFTLPHRPKGTQLPRRREVAGRDSRISPAEQHAALSTLAPRRLAHQGREGLKWRSRGRQRQGRE
jgi:hypothetical protein